MSYIAPVPPTPQGWDFAYSPHGVQNFEYLGNQYVFVRQGAEFGVGDGKLHVLKSINLGVTWVETANVAFPSSGTVPVPVAAYTVCLDGSKAYVLAVDTNGTSTFPGTDPLCGPLTLYVYDLAADTFISGPVVPGGAPVINKFWKGASYNVGSVAGLNLVRRGAGDMLLVYPGTPEVVGGLHYARVWVAAFDGSAFGTGAQMAGQTAVAGTFSQGAVGLDSAHILHVCMASGSGGRRYTHIAMDNTGTFGTLQTLETAGFFLHSGPPEEMSNLLASFSNNGVDSIGFLGVHQDFGDGLLTLYYAPSGALNPAWTSTPIVTSAPVVIGGGANGSALATSLQVISGLIVAFWTVSGTSPNWNVNDGLGRVQFSYAFATDITTWQPDALLFSGAATTFCAVSINSWSSTSIGLAVIGNFLENFTDFGESSDLGVFLPLTLTFANVPGTVGVPYSQSLVATSGTPPYVSYVVTSGAIPDCLTLNGTTGLISGTPCVAGTFSFVAQVTDSLGATATVNATILIAASTGVMPTQAVFGGAKLHTLPKCNVTGMDLSGFQKALEVLRPRWVAEVRVPRGPLCSKSGRIRT